MIESRSTEELATALCNGSVTVRSIWSSKNMESRVMMRGAPLEASIGAAGPLAASRLAAPLVPAAVAASAALPLTAAPPQPFATARGSSCATDYSTTVGETATTLAYTNSSMQGCSTVSGSSAAHLSGGWTNQGCCGGSSQMVVGEVAGDVRTSLRGFARGRWSRDSAAAAAAIWSNEASEAFAAAERFTASHMDAAAGTASKSESVWTARAGAAASATAPACGFGVLYGIRESGPVPSLAASLEFSDSDDGAVTVGRMRP